MIYSRSKILSISLQLIRKNLYLQERAMSKSALVILAQGAEEMETVITVDMLRRGGVILPGGLEGSDRLSKSEVVGMLLKEYEKAGKIVAAICAAPTAFVAHGVAQGKRVTSYPTTKDTIAKAAGGYQYVEGERVVTDGNIVTSRGPGTAYWFALKLIELLTGKEKSDQVEKGMIIAGY
ncbi:hypothetical protein K1T71_000977 [Dendrolimus kikuchii]|uniref:Uncharacterized protein n=1 Tax=Dendrolimus kikuchii TaxID=765133 RepID=A0ACC1DHZ6_9NEOP|nr:hypothetical protein K1T71_000977 [Dendrolimus kikuchii]